MTLLAGRPTESLTPIVMGVLVAATDCPGRGGQAVGAGCATAALSLSSRAGRASPHPTPIEN